jgi:uncharacterized protein (UPF0261 family)
MEIVVVGGTRLLGSKIVEKLHEGSHQPCRRHRSRARSTLTAVGSAGALDGVDMTSAPSFEDAAALRFTFQTSMRNLSSFRGLAQPDHDQTARAEGAQPKGGSAWALRGREASQ